MQTHTDTQGRNTDSQPETMDALFSKQVLKQCLSIERPLANH